MSERLVSTNSGKGRSRSFFARFKEADDKAKTLTFVDTEGNEVVTGVDNQGRRDKLSPSQLVMKRLAATTGGTSVNVVAKEEPWVRLAGVWGEGNVWRIQKVGTKYPKESRNEELVIDERVAMRKKVQDARRCLSGHGRTRVHTLDNGRLMVLFQFIKDGHGPAEAEPIDGANVYDEIKSLYKERYIAGMRQNYTFSSAQDDGYGEAPAMAPTCEDEHQPNSAYTQQRPLKPEEFARYIDNVADGLVERSDRLGKALRKVAEKGGEWKMVGGYSIKFSQRLINPASMSGTIGRSVPEDVEFGRALRANGKIDVKWSKPLDNLAGFAGYSVAGRAGILHDGFVPMEVVVARDPWTRHVCVDDVTMKTAPQYEVGALVPDPMAMEDWHIGRTREVAPTLDMLVPYNERRQEAAAQQETAEAPEADGNTVESFSDGNEATADEPGAGAWDSPGVELDDSADEAVPF